MANAEEIMDQWSVDQSSPIDDATVGVKVTQLLNALQTDSCFSPDDEERRRRCICHLHVLSARILMASGDYEEAESALRRALPNASWHAPRLESLRSECLRKILASRTPPRTNNRAVVDGKTPPEPTTTDRGKSTSLRSTGRATALAALEDVLDTSFRLEADYILDELVVDGQVNVRHVDTSTFGTQFGADHMRYFRLIAKRSCVMCDIQYRSDTAAVITLRKCS